MSEHHAYATINAPVHQVYTFFTHFNDFPKFMSFVKEVTYYDDQRSHWVAQVLGTYEWDAVNENWLPDQQIGWRSTNGLQNHGVVKFTPLTPSETQVNVYISYTPPAGILGTVAEHLGVDSRFDDVLQQDLQHFASMVEKAPPGSLDPMQSQYLFHENSAVARGNTTEQQHAAMRNDPMMHAEALQERETTIQHEAELAQQTQQAREAERKQQLERAQQAAQTHEESLKRQAESDQQQAQEQSHFQEVQTQAKIEPHPIYDTLGGRNASMERTAFGDQDSRSERFPMHHQDPMTSRAPRQKQTTTETAVSEQEVESPWRTNTPGEAPTSDQQDQTSR